MSRERREADVVVVGAGFAGLVATRELARGGADVVLVEARDRVGGRTLNEPVGDGKVVEIGGQWVGPTQDRLYALADEFGVGTYPTYIDGENLLELGGSLRRYSGTIPRLNPASLAEVELTRRRMNALAKKVSAEAPWESPDAARLDRLTLASWIRRHAHTRAARDLVEIAVRTIWGADSADVSLLFALWYLRAAGGFDPLVDTEGGAQQDRFVGGSQLIAERLAAELGQRVVLGAPVRRVEHGEAGVRVFAGESEIAARRAVLALAPALCGSISWDPMLPPARAQLQQRMPWGSYLKCLAVYDEPFWRADGLSGESVSVAGPATTTFDNTPHDGSPGILLGFASGAEARTLQRLDVAERRGAVLGGLARVFGPRAAKPERFIEQDWSREPYTGGAPVCFMPPGVLSSFGRAVAAPVGALHWAGTETSPGWSGYIEGAVRSGERVAAEVLAALGAPHGEEPRA